MPDRTNAVDGGIFPRGFSVETDFPFPLRRSDDLVELCYGKALREPDRIKGKVPVYGTNGRCGWHNTPLTDGPGVILGRKGMGARTVIDGGSITLFDGASYQGTSTGASPLFRPGQRWTDCASWLVERQRSRAVR